MSAREPVTVVGAGAVGLAVALELARDGRAVTLADYGRHASASAAAAGMLAPASEAVIDDVSPSAAAALLHARGRWSDWGDRLGLAIEPAGALHVDREATLDARERAAAGLGLGAERRGAEALFLPQDAVLEPAQALAALARAAAEAGVVRSRARASALDGRIVLDGAPVRGEVVIAAGWGSSALVAAAPELASLQPIKGQLLRLFGTSQPGPVLRGAEVYLVPHAGGWIAGATMEPGRDDLVPDADALGRLRACAAALRPELAHASSSPAVGVRAATPDGAPLVGRSRSGVWLATGMRRNGWLLAPLVAEGIAAYLAGRDPDPALAGQARAWDPARVLSDQGPA